MFDAPMQAIPLPEASGHYIKLGRISTKCLIVKRKMIETIAQKSWKITNPILANTLLFIPQHPQSLQRHPQQAVPAQQSAEPAQHNAAKHIFC